MEQLIGKPVIVRANVAGVHAGILESLESEKQTVSLKSAFRLWRVYTRDMSGSVSDTAANGLKKDGNHTIGAELNRVVIVNPQGLEIAEMTPDAYESVRAWQN